MVAGEPVAVDMEGIERGVTGMIQVCDSERNIYLFRTSLNPGLYKAGLSRLLESPHILKILHFATVDCQSVYRDGVKMWNLYDTSIGYKVLQYQTSGTSIYSSPSIGFNDLCEFCGLEENPLKEWYRDRLWRMLMYDRLLEKKGELPQEIVLYCAWDVEPLHDIHTTLSSLIDPDYKPILQHATDIELIRPIDSDLARRKRTSIKNIELCNVFLSGLADNTRKPDIYQLIAGETGQKHVYFSYCDNTANVILDSRQAALDAYKRLSNEGFPKEYGRRARAELVVAAVPSEVGEEIITQDKETERNDSWVT